MEKGKLSRACQLQLSCRQVRLYLAMSAGYNGVSGRHGFNRVVYAGNNGVIHIRDSKNKP